MVTTNALAAAGYHAAIAASRLDHQRTFAERARFGLLAVNVLAGTTGFDHVDRVPMVGRGDVYRVDVFAGQQFAEVVVRLAIRVAVLVVDLVLGAIADVAADVADGHVLNVIAAKEGTLVAASHVADADTAHDDSFARRGTVVGT